MSDIRPCSRCAAPVPVHAMGCPSCGASGREVESRPVAMLLLGLSVSGCNGINAQPDYGVAITDTGLIIDDDGDGFAEMDGDCDDSDPAVHPEAKETPGDGVDSNCDGEDDT